MLTRANKLSYRNAILSEAAYGGLPRNYWPLDEVNGSAAVDLMTIARGSGVNGTFSSVTLGGAGLINKDESRAPTFGGLGGGSFVTCGIASNFTLTSGTLEAWINTSDAGASFRGIVLKQGAWGLFLIDNVLATYDWVGESELSTSVNVADGSPHHVAMSFQSGVSNGTKLYVDGTVALTTQITILQQTQALVIGAGEDTGSVQNFAGQIAQCALYDYELGADRIQYHYLAGLNGIYGGK